MACRANADARGRYCRWVEFLTVIPEIDALTHLMLRIVERDDETDAGD